jgi:hypothetical protein
MDQPLQGQEASQEPPRKKPAAKLTYPEIHCLRRERPSFKAKQLEKYDLGTRNRCEAVASENT